MGCYQASWGNRIYVGGESEFGAVSTERKLVPAVRLQVKHEREWVKRKDKLGTRTVQGVTRGARQMTGWALRTYFTDWKQSETVPQYDPLFRGLAGGNVRMSATRSAVVQGREVSFSGGDPLSVGQAIAMGGELRFVIGVTSESQVYVNAPFRSGNGATNRAVTYELGSDLRSVTIIDHWQPETAVQRIVRGAGVDRFELRLNGDFHTFDFAGPAADVMDNQSYINGEGGLVKYPDDPGGTEGIASVVPGNLGQIWIGSTPDRIHSLLEGTVRIRNGIEMRSREFGSTLPRCMSPGPREVELSFSLFAEDKNHLKELYEAARSQSPVPVMLQLGESPGEMFGVFLKSVMLQVPEFDDTDQRLVWEFKANRAGGSSDDEAYMAFA